MNTKPINSKMEQAQRNTRRSLRESQPIIVRSEAMNFSRGLGETFDSGLTAVMEAQYRGA